MFQISCLIKSFSTLSFSWYKQRRLPDRAACLNMNQKTVLLCWCFFVVRYIFIQNNMLIFSFGFLLILYIVIFSLWSALTMFCRAGDGSKSLWGFRKHLQNSKRNQMLRDYSIEGLNNQLEDEINPEGTSEVSTNFPALTPSCLCRVTHFIISTDPSYSSWWQTDGSFPFVFVRFFKLFRN